MMIILRCDDKFDSGVIEVGQQPKVSKSKWMDAVVFGRYGSRCETLSENRKTLLKAKIQEKRSGKV